ncbi:glycoside hydrolase family 97 protein [Candidatus Saccharibacteria bacterium]|nr:glycoside hydrolase family 97 protein [Candidatus Saccharibacteria bacterium]
MLNKRKIKDVSSKILSPNKNITCILILKKGQLFYSVVKNDQEIIKKSQLGIEICGEGILGENLNLIREQKTFHDETIEMPWGEDRWIENKYNESSFFLAENTTLGRIMTLRIRVFDTGVAFRYEIPPQPKFRQISIKDELTEFNLSPSSTVWQIPAYQPDRYEYCYTKTKLGLLTGSVHTPLTIQTPDKTYLSIHEAALYNYGSMTLCLNNSILKSDITPLSDNTKAHVVLPFCTPWRLIMIADTAIDLTKNRLIYALNEPPTSDFSWVKTLKFIGIWWAMYVGEWSWAPGDKHGATTTHAKEYIDAAVKLGISGLLIEGWNDGWEGNWLENGINNKFTVPTSDFDFESVANYAKRRNVELVGHHETVGFVDNYEEQLEAAYNYYAVNGVRYIKTGYAGSKMTINGRQEFHHSQRGVNHYQKTVELAASKHICLNIHEPIKGTGLERTWPNLLAREGARGQEYEGGSLTPSHACFLPYTRLLSGGMDYTSGILDIKNTTKRVYTTISRQLAYYITIYSGMQMAADRPFMYLDRYPDLFEFIKCVPTNFEKTLPLSGEIGEYYLVARKDRDSANWYIGGITNEKSRQVDIVLDFLDDENYQAMIYFDKNDAHYKTNPDSYQIKHKKIKRGDTITIFIAPGGGFAIELQRL